MKIISFHYSIASEELMVLYKDHTTKLLSIRGLELYELLRREGYAQDYNYKRGILINSYSYKVSDPRGVHGVMIEEQEYTLPLEDFMLAELGGASGATLVKDLVKRLHGDRERRFHKRLRRFWKIITTPII
jgi:hypothetical protein